MEVHSHTHTERKKWTHYVWEFIMLFLAVFCGFLAENIREHAAEHSRAKEFSKSLVLDLQNDTAAIRNQERIAEVYISFADSLLKLAEMKLDGGNASKFSFYTRFMYWTTPISWNRATFEQIKNSGSLRYFKNSALLGKLMRYDALINELNVEFLNNQVRGNMLLTQIDKIIEPGFHRAVSKYFLLGTISRQTMDSAFSMKTGSLENKRDLVNEMLNMIIVQQRNLRLNINTRWDGAEKLATELIGDFKKEYSLE